MGALSILFRDFLFIMIFLLLMLINPVVETNEATKAPGNMMITVVWPNEPNDVDLWMKSPMDSSSVGYLRKSGPVWNLLRDDLGTGEDASGMNYENGFARGTPDGEYIVNLHCFTCTGEIPVDVDIKIMTPDGTASVVHQERVVLKKNKEEITVVRFQIKDNHLVASSKHSVFQSLR